MIAVRYGVFFAGTVLIGWTLLSAIRAVVLPRGDVVLLSRIVFVNVRRVFNLLTKPAKTYEQQDRVMALYAPIGLLALSATAWLVARRPGRKGDAGT